MRKSRFTDQEKLEILELKDSLGISAEELCATYQISIATYYIWKRQLKTSHKTSETIESSKGDFQELRQLYINLSEHNHKLAQFIKSQ